MSLNEILKDVINRNVKNEELRNIIYKFCTEEGQSVCETESALVTSRCFSEYRLEESEIIVSIILDNIDSDMEFYSAYLPSGMRNLVGMLEANIHGSIVFQSKKKYAGIAENGLWDLKEKI